MNIKSFFKNTLLAATLVTLVSCTTTGIIGRSKKEYTLAELKEESRALKTDITYPLFDNCPELNMILDEKIIQEYNSYAKDVKEAWAESEAVAKKIYGDDSYVPRQYEYIVKCDPVMANDSFISLRVDTYIYSGGAHGNTSVETFTYDKKKNTLVSLKDVSPFSDAELIQICRTSLAEKITKIQGSAADQNWIKRGTSPLPKTFLYDGKKLVLIFGQYLVAPYSCGILDVDIPLK